ncbi:putative 2-aminoethylphosphonate ABC transporter permease subunit [Janthinobacterium fluminis]|uniref:2-aminoethylphosphonate ABC transporter permease subunit n=1 Tax=Janthinobacterium fluminis TaxID=2987524 RepID=A0ABT5JX59_9BURK|nr:putative 2-aminoethylphosphonate ABC transporter permease subunit [Janthinobacterium fluminis]MDC8757325.1 putative 2-aminoethylphosphonate ABC transporter permease subunit [Janthinobacterium fluminis]
MSRSAMPAFAAPSLRSRDEQAAGLLAWLLAGALLLFILLPLASIFVKAVQDRDGAFIGLAEVLRMLAEPRIQSATLNSLGLAALTMAVVLPAAFAFAFALTRSRIPGAAAFRLIALSPLLAPSLMPAISLVYLFGNQGLLKDWLGATSIYGPLGIVMGEVFYTFPHALLILCAALAVADARLYEAGTALGAGVARRFLTITLPGARYGLVSAGTLVFTMVVADFGVPKVIGGQTNVLALEAYKQVLGQQNFNRGAVIGLLLLLPAVLSFILERRVSRRHGATMTGKSVPYRAKPAAGRDAALWLFCALVSAFLLALIGVAVAAAFIDLWPYKMSLTLKHFDFEQLDGGGWQAFRNSLAVAACSAALGSAVVFLTAYLVEKLPVPRLAVLTIRGVILLPMAVPGMVLGLGYVLFFNAPGNPLHVLFASMTMLVASTVAHLYSTAHLTITTALRQIDPEMEAVARSLNRPWWLSCARVTLPLALPALLNVLRYLFVSSMTTVSCVIFLYTPDTVLASVAVLNMDDAGDTAAAAAMATLIVAASLAVSLALNALGWWCERRAQIWRAA